MKRPNNTCGSCGYTWAPRGHDLSKCCPSCKSVDISETNYGDSGGYWNSTPEEMKTYIRRYSRNWALVSIIPTFLFASVLSLSLNMKEGGMKQYTFMSVSALIGAVCVYKAVKYDYIKTLERLQIKTLERLQ